ncbi:MAG TPA: alkaline phosphatase family protein [Caldithrix abyssi]|uniref:Alkaline phosphatase family protein n=1 Tax=Caldithrix abyssi TaxID=187145 RepID=A0A7V1LMG7_CALAY|nr:alkaline phosphatase family protein [Caldithrix abyssi]
MKGLFWRILLLATLTFAKPYVLLISWDGFRWDYPDKGDFSALKYMQENGVRAQSLQPVFPSKTFPNHYSLVTGMYPARHGMIFNSFTDPRTGIFYSTRRKTKNGLFPTDWYRGEPIWITARRNGIKSASVFWVGTEVIDKQRRPDYFEFYNHYMPHETRIAKILEHLQRPRAERPHFLSLYFSDTDDYGHKFGPDSREIPRAIRKLDQSLGRIFRGIEEIGLADSVNIILVSDHGMTETSPQRVVPVDSLLSGLEYTVNGSGQVSSFLADAGTVDRIEKRLRAYGRGFNLYRRDNIPAYYHFSGHPAIGPLVLIADPGWYLRIKFPLSSRGAHGYDNRFLEMHGIFMAMGPAFKKHYRTGMLRNIDVYPLMCHILGIRPNPDMDGELIKIMHVLKQ